MTERFILKDQETTEVYPLPIVQSEAGPLGLDIRELYKRFGLFSYDPGFISTASCQSKITFIDGEAGVLQYRGYPVEELAEKSQFVEVSYLLLHGELPTPAQLATFSQRLKRESMIHESLKSFFHSFHHDAHPMAIMVGVVGSLSAFYHEELDLADPANRLRMAERMLAKIPTIAAASYKHSVGEPFVYPDQKLSYTANFLNMLFSVPSTPYVVDPLAEKALDLLFILHADHEQNASTSTVRMAGSSGANPFACIAAGIASLWGPAHGGANEAALGMLKEIGEVTNIPKFLARAKDKNDSFRLMGFGHRVYKNYDPRATIIREMCHKILTHLHAGKDDPLLEVALELERQAMADDYFISRKLYPNVDFYSGLIYRALGIPTNMFTVMFALARTAGWMAHWLEMMEAPEHRINRPRQVYTGAPKRDYLPPGER